MAIRSHIIKMYLGLGINIYSKVVGHVHRRNFCTKYSNIRNIAILAHIDAGKTTTTERLLFYAGKTVSMGEVHRGNTITDYLAQERERGITVCSSAVTFPWNNTRINLIDTPGHIDFTMEIEQALNAVDGVVILLDGTSGVEAQTLTVWSQSEKMKLPKIIFVNKMDRPDASFEKCLSDIETKLDIRPVCLQYPVNDSKEILGIIDIVQEKQFVWIGKTLGRKFIEVPLQINLDEVKRKKRVIIDKLCENDNELAEFVINNESYNKVSNNMIWRSIRRAACNRKIVPFY